MTAASSGRRSCAGNTVLTLVRPINATVGTRGISATNGSSVCQGDCVHERSHGESGVRPAIFTATESVFVDAIGTTTTPDEVSCDSYTEQGSALHYTVEHQDAKFNLHRGALTRQDSQLPAVSTLVQLPSGCMTHRAGGGAASAGVAGPSPDRT